MMPIPLPWLLVAACALFGAGVWYGDSNADTACDLEAAEARVRGAEKFAQEMKQATDASLAIADVSIGFEGTFVVTRARTHTIEVEVSRDVDAHPDLARCLVPAVTRGLRNDQVSISAAIAAGDRPVR